MKRFENKVVVVLGASAERGTGWGIAEAFAAEGAKVVVAARSEAPLKILAERIDGTAVVCDVASEEQVRNLADVALATYGKVDIAVNSAGAPAPGLISDFPREQLQFMVDVNYFGMVYFTREMARVMGEREQGNEGSIILVTSNSTTHPVEPHFGYACAKAATNCMVTYAAKEFGRQGIKVNAILPGPILSDMVGDSFDDPQAKAAFLKEIPMNRMAYPADIADAAMWLAGPSFTTGLNLQVNGGQQLCRHPFPSELPGGLDQYENAAAMADRK